MVLRRSAIARAPAICIEYIWMNVSTCVTTSRPASVSPSRISSPG